MTKSKRSGEKTPKEAATTPTHPPGEIRMKPRKRLLVVLSIVLGIWIAALVTMYFTTVFPHRKHEPQETELRVKLTAAWSQLVRG